MANQEHLDILEQGVDIWNKWREQQPAFGGLAGLPSSYNIPWDEWEKNQYRLGNDLNQANVSTNTIGYIPNTFIYMKTGGFGSEPNPHTYIADLSEADIPTTDDFSFANFSAVNLSGAGLSYCVLDGSDFRRANLQQAGFKKAHLTDADLSGANLTDADLTLAHLNSAKIRGAYLIRANLWDADLSKADLSGSDLSSAYLRGANLKGANLSTVNLSKADLSGANLKGANLFQADLFRADLRGADLRGAKLSETKLVGATLIDADLRKATLKGCQVYGISIWDVKLQGAIQENLVITDDNQPDITVDNLKIAQFIYLLLNNKEVRDVIDTLTTKAVLILGRFTSPRKAILDAIRNELRKRNYLPILFDFEKPVNRDITETISTLSHLARFVIADITDAKSIPQELMAIVPHLPSVPVAPILQVSDREYGMYEHFVSYPWVLPMYHYHDLDELLRSIQKYIIDPAEKKVKELAIEKAKRLEKP